MRAMMSLRLEKAFGAWLREYRPDYLPLETGLGRFVAYNKAADFIGKAVAAELAAGPARRLCSLWSMPRMRMCGLTSRYG
jgi:dimethylglycine dehydrogenase